VSPQVPLETLRRFYFPTPQDEHELDPSYEETEAGHDPHNARILKDLQKMVGVGLVVPVGEEHMYYAAMNSKSCRLTRSERNTGAWPTRRSCESRCEWEQGDEADGRRP
jgi:hypothetical protein